MQNICCKSKANNCHLLCGQQKRRDERVESGSHQSSGTKSGVSSSEKWAKENDKCLWNKSNNTDGKLSVATLSWILFFLSLIWFSYSKAAVLLCATHWGKHWKWRLAVAALIAIKWNAIKTNSRRFLPLSKQSLSPFFPFWLATHCSSSSGKKLRRRQNVLFPFQTKSATATVSRQSEISLVWSFLLLQSGSLVVEIVFPSATLFSFFTFHRHLLMLLTKNLLMNGTVAEQ